jgi:hypothetical protein
MRDPMYLRIPWFSSPLSFGINDPNAASTVPGTADEFTQRMHQLGVTVIHNTFIEDEPQGRLHEKP